MLLQATRVAVGAAKLAGASALGLADAAGTLAAPVLTRSAVGVARAARIPQVADKLGELADAGLHRAKRRVWSADGRAHVEVRGLPGTATRAPSAGLEHLTAALREIKGVRWAEINAVTQHILVDFDEDELDVDPIIEVHRGGRGGARHRRRRTSPALKPEHPSADAPGQPGRSSPWPPTRSV